MLKQNFVRDLTFDLLKFWGSLLKKLPFSFHFLSFSFIFSLAKHPLRMTTQRMSG